MVFDVSAYIQEAQIRMASDVYAVEGVQDRAVLDCELVGFTPPSRGQPQTLSPNSQSQSGLSGAGTHGIGADLAASMPPWSITWTKSGDDFSLLTNYMGITYSQHGDRVRTPSYQAFHPSTKTKPKPI